MTDQQHLCPDGKYRGCDFLGCSDRVDQAIAMGRNPNLSRHDIFIPPCRLSKPVPCPT